MYSKWEKADTYQVRLGKVMHIAANHDNSKLVISSEQSGGSFSVLSLTDGKLQFVRIYLFFGCLSLQYFFMQIQ